MGERIIVAEDSPTQARMLKATLEGAGFEATVASDGEQALELLEAQQFDLVLSDIVMPGIDGYELCRRVKASDPHLPVVLLTSLTDPLEVVRGLAAGADNFLHKPYDGEHLLARIRTILFNRELRRQGKAQMGLELFFLGKRFMITADRQQILDLLVSTFEDLVVMNQELRERERELAQANEDVSTRLAEVELERRRLDAVLASLPQGFVVVDKEGRIVDVNAAGAQLFGTTVETLIGREAATTAPFVDRSGNPIPPEAKPVSSALARNEMAELGKAFDLFLARPDGTRLPIIARAAPIRDGRGEIVGAVGVVDEIGGLVAHDPLTGLPGHPVFVDRAARAVEMSAAEGATTAIMVVVVDRFARLRHNLAPLAADQLVAEVAGRLSTLLTTSSAGTMVRSAAHLGNGEFAVVVPGLASQLQAMRTARWLSTDLRGTIALDDVDVAVTFSVGVALCDEGEDPRNAVSAAAAAARRATADGGERVIAADEALHADTAGQLRLEHELREAMVAGQLAVHYQPQVLLGTGHAVGAEALVRWHHPERGLLQAGAFMQVAHDAGLVAEISWWALEEACRQAARWRTELPGGRSFVMSVNVAAEQLAEPDIAERMRSILASSGLEPSGLVLEITETGVMRDPDAASARLTALKSIGVRVAVDDFGTGHSSLTHLRQLPVDIVKIDRSFVGGIPASDEDAAIVAGTARLAHTLGIEVVAEGVENEEQLVRLRMLGCETAQGHHWAAALPPQELASWWSQNASRVPGQGMVARPPIDPLDGRRDDTLAYLVHELSSPLTTVIGFGELLRNEVPEGPARDYVEAVMRSAWDLDGRLRLLAEARDLMEGRMPLEIGRHDVAELLRVLVHDVAPQLVPHEVVLDAVAPVVADVDGDRVVQAVSNLLSNAAKFSPATAPIHVSVTEDGPSVEIRVRDEGPGVPEHRRAELFRRFARLGSKTKGMGLGLYLVRMVAVAHGGDARYEPVAGRGACFVLSLPRERTTSTQPGQNVQS